MSVQRKPWRDLKIGDRTRVVRMSPDFTLQNYETFPETVAVYRSLIETGQILTINEIDEWHQPWANCFEVTDPTQRGLHCLKVSDDSWVRVRDNE